MPWMVGSAFAQDLPIDEAPQVNSQLYRHSVDSELTLWSDDSGRISDDPEFNVRFATNYVRNPFLVQWSDGTETVLARQAWQVDLMGAIQYDRFRLGVSLPGYLTSAGDLSQGGAGLSDIALNARVTILERDDAPVGLAAGGRTSFPTSTIDVPVGSTLEWELFGIVDRKFGDFLLTTNLAYRGVPRAELLNVVWGDQLALRAGGAYDFGETAVSLDLGGSTSVPNWSVFNRDRSRGAAVPLEAVLGATQTVATDWRVSAGLGKGLTRGIGSPAYRLIAAVEYRPRPQPNLDIDGDGILNAQDQCPEEPEDFDGLYDDDGCIDEAAEVFVGVVDPDGNPIFDAELVTVGWEGSPRVGRPWTAMPGTYAIKAKAPGYIDQVTTIEAKGDVGTQRFTITLEPITTTGTLVVTVRMEDGTPFEGSTISIDDSEFEVGPEIEKVLPEGEHTLVIQAGEGFQTAERVAVVEAESTTRIDVTLAQVRVVVTEDRIDLRESIFFETAKAVIKDVSFSLMDEVVQILKDHPELTKLRIEGHTDSRGSASYNKKLSQQRADSVMAYLVRAGVEKERLEAVGFGEERPLDDRQVEEAWEKNRRVDFFVVERSD